MHPPDHSSTLSHCSWLTVRDINDGKHLILSNNHVLANLSSGVDGRAAPGDAILQPGSHDGGQMDKDIIGRLERFVPMKRTFQPSECSVAHFLEIIANKLLKVLYPSYQVSLQRKNEQGNLVDAALATPFKKNDLSEEILELEKVTGVAEAFLGQDIVFSGRTSGVVHGS